MLHVPITSPLAATAAMPILPPDAMAEATALSGLARSGRWAHATLRASSRHTIVHLTRGAGRLVMGGLRHGHSAGDAAFVPAGVSFAIELPPGAQGTLFSIPASAIPGAPRAPRRARSPGSEAVAEAAAMAARLAAEIRGDRPGRTRGIACHAGILTLWIEREWRPSARLGEAEALSRDFAALLESQLASGRRTGDYARALGAAPEALDAACRAVIGRAAEEALTERLVHEIGRHLRRTDRPVDEIARRLGLGSAGEIAHLLVSRRGVTPEAVRTGGSRPSAARRHGQAGARALQSPPVSCPLSA